MNALLGPHQVLPDKNRIEFQKLRVDYDKKIKVWKSQHIIEAKKATGLIEGDYVEYIAVSPFGMTEAFTGKVVVYKGLLKVKLDAKHMGKRYASVHKGWKKIK